MPGAVPGAGDEAVNQAGTVPAPKGQKTDKQVITIQCDETDNPGCPRQLNSVAGEQGWGSGAGRLFTVFLVVALGL